MKRNAKPPTSTKQIPTKDKYGKPIISTQKPNSTSNRAESKPRNPSVPRFVKQTPNTANPITTKRPNLNPENESIANKPTKRSVPNQKEDYDSFEDDNVISNQKPGKYDNNNFSEKKEEGYGRNTIATNKEETQRSNMSR